MDEKILPVGNKVMIMNDRELLELAAKAAGYQLKRMCDPVESGEEGSDFFHLDNRYWNPLTDDGDALRLAVKAGLLQDDDRWSMLQKFRGELTGFDYSGARRAIVLAAAEIGRAML